MRGLHFLFSVFMLFGFSYPAIAADEITDFLQEKIEGVALSMTVQEAKTELKKRGYTPVGEIENHEYINGAQHTYRYQKDGKYKVAITTARTYKDASAPLTRNLSDISYKEDIPKIVDIYNPQTHYVCPKVIAQYKRFCPQAGEQSCQFDSNVRIYSHNYHIRHHPDDKFMLEANAQVNQRCGIMLMRKSPYRPQL